MALARRSDFAAFLKASETRAAIAAQPYARYLTTITGQERCDLFIRLEHLAADIARFESHLGFRLAPLPRANRSDRRPDWRGYYCDETAAIVGKTCAADIARFGYRFDPD